MSTLAVASVAVGDVEYVVAINIEVSNGIVYAPTGVCGEASTLNNGGWILWVDTCKPLELKSEPLPKVILVTLLENGVSISAGIRCFSPCLMTIFSGCVNMSILAGGIAIQPEKSLTSFDLKDSAV